MTAVEVPVRAPGPGSLGVRLVPSVLSERLAAHEDAARAFRAARHRFIDGDRIDGLVQRVRASADELSGLLNHQPRASGAKVVPLRTAR